MGRRFGPYLEITVPLSSRILLGCSTGYRLEAHGPLAILERPSRDGLLADRGREVLHAHGDPRIRQCLCWHPVRSIQSLEGFEAGIRFQRISGLPPNTG